MSSPWIATSNVLPHDGESVQFLPDDREVGLNGTYYSGAFCSRWTCYDVGRVRAWHARWPARAGPSLLVSGSAPLNAFLGWMQRARTLLGDRAAAVPEIPEIRHPIRAAHRAAAPVTARSPAAPSPARNSNQMSS